MNDLVFDDSFQTLAAPTEGLYKEKGSKFLAFAYPVENEGEIKEKIASLKKEYYDARHHCYAFMLGKDGQHFRAADDGEPNNSAGIPILGQIRSKNLTNVLVVVVRYFGGTKLGVGGLVQAYKTATAEALAVGEIVTKYLEQTIDIYFGYEAMNEVMRVIKDHELPVLKQDFLQACLLQTRVRESLLPEVKGKLEKVGKVELVDIAP